VITADANSLVTAEVESFERAIPEIVKWFPQHWEELGIFKDRMPLVPQFDEYIARERQGRLFLVAVRKDGKIVGYYTAQVSPHLHYAHTLTAHMDMCYIPPEHRNRGIALPLFRTVERELRRRGVQMWYSGCKIHNPLGMPRLHELLGFVPSDEYYAKWLGD
jgi:L-amino acid N-acyltransferase YncA